MDNLSDAIAIKIAESGSDTPLLSVFKEDVYITFKITEEQLREMAEKIKVLLQQSDHKRTSESLADESGSDRSFDLINGNCNKTPQKKIDGFHNGICVNDKKSAECSKKPVKVNENSMPQSNFGSEESVDCQQNGQSKEISSDSENCAVCQSFQLLECSPSGDNDSVLQQDTDQASANTTEDGTETLDISVNGELSQNSQSAEEKIMVKIPRDFIKLKCEKSSRDLIPEVTKSAENDESETIKGSTNLVSGLASLPPSDVVLDANVACKTEENRETDASNADTGDFEDPSGDDGIVDDSMSKCETEHTINKTFEENRSYECLRASILSPNTNFGPCHCPELETVWPEIDGFCVDEKITVKELDFLESFLNPTKYLKIELPDDFILIRVSNENEELSAEAVKYKKIGTKSESISEKTNSVTSLSEMPAFNVSEKDKIPERISGTTTETLSECRAELNEKISDLTDGVSEISLESEVTPTNQLGSENLSIAESVGGKELRTNICDGDSISLKITSDELSKNAATLLKPPETKIRTKFMECEVSKPVAENPAEDITNEQSTKAISNNLYSEQNITEDTSGPVSAEKVSISSDCSFKESNISIQNNSMEKSIAEDSDLQEKSYSEVNTPSDSESTVKSPISPNTVYSNKRTLASLVQTCLSNHNEIEPSKTVSASVDESAVKVGVPVDTTESGSPKKHPEECKGHSPEMVTEDGGNEDSESSNVKREKVPLKSKEKDREDVCEGEDNNNITLEQSSNDNSKDNACEESNTFSTEKRLVELRKDFFENISMKDSGNSLEKMAAKEANGSPNISAEDEAKSVPVKNRETNSAEDAAFNLTAKVAVETKASESICKKSPVKIESASPNNLSTGNPKIYEEVSECSADTLSDDSSIHQEKIDGKNENEFSNEDTDIALSKELELLETTIDNAQMIENDAEEFREICDSMDNISDEETEQSKDLKSDLDDNSENASELKVADASNMNSKFKKPVEIIVRDPLNETVNLEEKVDISEIEKSTCASSENKTTENDPLVERNAEDSEEASENRNESSATTSANQIVEDETEDDVSAPQSLDETEISENSTGAVSEGDLLESDDSRSVASESDDGRESKGHSSKSHKKNRSGTDEVDCAPTRVRTTKTGSALSKDTIPEDSVIKNVKFTKGQSLIGSAFKRAGRVSPSGRSLRAKSLDIPAQPTKISSTGRKSDLHVPDEAGRKREKTPEVLSKRDLKTTLRSSPRKLPKMPSVYGESIPTPKTPNTRSAAAAAAATEAQSKSRSNPNTSTSSVTTRRTKRV